ncbi:ankyrin repeat domain-containing protein [Vampirovibrio sp.]|uniref:ankyrin repeat domain-containing protein n=1 Tax=Vampirovibrio sp. TaxID=2717857 RepID=UPI00359365B2
MYVNGHSSQEKTPLALAVKCDNVEAVKSLIDAGADVNLPEYSYWTDDIPIYAVRSAEVLKLLVKAGVDIERKKDGNTPIKHYTQCDRIDLVEGLIAAGANLNARDDNGWTAAKWAKYFNYKKIYNALIRAGAEKPQSDGCIVM